MREIYIAVILDLERLVSLLKELVNEHVVHFTLDQLLYSLIEIDAVLRFHQKVLQEVIQNILLIFKALHVYELLL